MLLTKDKALCGCGKFTQPLSDPKAFDKIGAHERMHTTLGVDVS